jgi:S1-C subfamily serine protease
MMRASAFTILLLVVAATVQSAAQSGPNLEQLSEARFGGVAIDIYFEGGQHQPGSGFIVRAGRIAGEIDTLYIATANHVLDQPLDAAIVLRAEDGEIRVRLPFLSARYSAFVVRRHPELDLAIIAVSGLENFSFPEPPIPLIGNIEALGPGEPMFTVVYNGAVVEPLYHGVVFERSGPRWFDFRAPLITEGYSGGSVYDQRARLSGVVTNQGRNVQDTSTGRAIVSTALARWINRLFGSLVLSRDPSAVTALLLSAVSAGGGRTCGIQAGGELYCWGTAVAGLEPIDLEEPSLFGRLSGQHVIRLSVGADGLCFVQHYTMVACGSGAGEPPPYGEIPEVDGARINSNVIDVSGSFACAVPEHAARTTVCWGVEAPGRAVGESTGSGVRRTTLRNTAKIDRLAAGGRHACALTRDGLVHCWGEDADGQLGRAGSQVPIADADTVAGGHRFRVVVAGDAHTCGITQRRSGNPGGDLLCWGSNSAGQLGIGGVTSVPVPTAVGSERTWKDVTAGGWHTCGITDRDQVFCWGANEAGQLGAGHISPQESSPQAVRVPADARLDVLTAGVSHTCGRTARGQTFCWGRNLDGEVGVPPSPAEPNPRVVQIR